MYTRPEAAVLCSASPSDSCPQITKLSTYSVLLMNTIFPLDLVIPDLVVKKCQEVLEDIIQPSDSDAALTTLHLITVIDLPIFSLFLSTPPIFHSFKPKYQSDISSQVVNLDVPLPPPITETSFDDLSFPVIEGRVTLDEVIGDRWISHLGQPLYEHSPFLQSVNKLTAWKRFGSCYDATVMREEHSDFHSHNLMDFVKLKLLDGPTRITDMKGVGSLACLAMHFALDFNLADKLAQDVTLTLIE